MPIAIRMTRTLALFIAIPVGSMAVGFGLGMAAGRHQERSAVRASAADDALRALVTDSKADQTDRDLRAFAAQNNSTTWPLLKASGLGGGTMFCFLRLNTGDGYKEPGGWAVTVYDELGKPQSHATLLRSDSVDAEVRRRFGEANDPVPVIATLQNHPQDSSLYVHRIDRWLSWDDIRPKAP